MALNHARLPIPPLGQRTKCEFWNLERGVMFRYAPEAHLLIPHSGLPSRTVTPAGFEPATHGLKVRCSARLSYEVGLLQRHLCVCHPGASVRGAGREAFVRLTQWRAHTLGRDALSGERRRCVVFVGEKERVGSEAGQRSVVALAADGSKNRAKR